MFKTVRLSLSGHQLKNILSKKCSSKIFSLLAEMPKDMKHARMMKEQRLKAKNNSDEKNKVVPSEFILHVLGNGSKGSSRSLYVFTSNTRYLFNCGEGTQRLAHEHKTKLSKLEHIFFTYKNWNNIGGLPGLTLTVQDIGLPELKLHGPPGIEDIYGMTKGFLVTKDIKISKHEIDDPEFKDHTMSVKTVLIKGGKKVKYENIPKNSYPVEEWIDEKRGSFDYSQANKRLKIDDNQDISVAYVCKLNSKPGQLCLEKCVEAGVPPGPLLGKLKNKEDVALPDGKVILSKDVTSPDEPGPLFIVIECPTEDFLDDLNNNNVWHQYQLGEASSSYTSPRVIVHFTPDNVIKHSLYQQWIKRFSPSTHHIMINDSNLGPSSYSVHRIQHQLNLLSDQIFPLLKTPIVNSAESTPCLLKYNLRPDTGFDNESIVKIVPDEYIKEVTAIEGFDEKLTQFKSQLSDKCIVSTNAEYPEIVFLGTGSSVPSKARNTSGILIHLTPEISMLLDCGEGTFGQMMHCIGHENIDDALMKIRCIFVSHLHADHHLGLIQVIQERRKAYEKCSKEFVPVELIAPSSIMKWLSSYHQRFENILHLFSISPNKLFNFLDKGATEDLYSRLLQLLDLKELLTVQVKHCWSAYGIVLTHVSGCKIVYSGDTMPCQDLVDAGNECNILIHEATMEDDLAEDAAYKTHSTTSQAIEIGHKMKAKFTMLTHFSQRYAKVPLFNENFHKNVGIAFDNMIVRPRDFPVLPIMNPVLKTMFEEQYKFMEIKRMKRTIKKERQLRSSSS